MNFSDAAGLDMDKFIEDVKEEKLEELEQAYVRRESGAVEQVNEILAANGCTMDDLINDALTKSDNSSGIDCLAFIERIDHLATIAEARRNTSLREIDRHRSVLADALQRKVKDVENGDFKVIETGLAEEKSAA